MSIRQVLLSACLGGAICFAHVLHAQPTEEPSPQVEQTNLDDFTERDIVRDRAPLAYQPVREADILWEKRIWRIIDVREKMNKPFHSPESPLFDLIAKAAMKGDLPVFSTADDRFTTRLSTEDVTDMLYRTDTVFTIDFNTGVEQMQVVQNSYNWEDVRRFRVKEAWFFDARTGSLEVRILGIAPMIDVRDNEGNFRFEKPLFWVHYPTARPFLASHKVVMNEGNLAATTTWEDIFEMRYFSSMVMKENNVGDLRLTDMYSGVDMLHQSQKIEDALFNFEHDVWSW